MCPIQLDFGPIQLDFGPIQLISPDTYAIHMQEFLLYLVLLKMYTLRCTCDHYFWGIILT
jgi:hypothetical protein